MEINGNKKSQKVAKSRNFTLREHLLSYLFLNDNEINNKIIY
jgi:hypothetical protein